MVNTCKKEKKIYIFMLLCLYYKLQGDLCYEIRPIIHFWVYIYIYLYSGPSVTVFFPVFSYFLNVQLWNLCEVLFSLQYIPSWILQCDNR